MKSDEQMRIHVIDELHWDPKLDGAEITVNVKSSIVILSGQVDSFGTKIAAEDAVKRIKDVQGIVEEITVHLPNECKRKDFEIAQAAINAIKWHHNLPDEQIKVEVENGWLTLDGKVDWQYQKDAAANMVKDIIGLKGLTNQIVIRPVIFIPVVKDEIKKALSRSANIVSDNIFIETFGNKVILRGKVRSWSERNEVEKATWRAPGVMEVEDNIVIA